MYYHLILTDSCNLCCTYCRGKLLSGVAEEEQAYIPDLELPDEPAYDLDDLYRFLAKDSEAVLTFYGGEPLLRNDLIREVMDHAPVKRFMVQTNGLLLDRLGADYVNRFDTILVSLDGDEEWNDRHRGAGTYRQVMRNVQAIEAEGCRAELIARMTVPFGADIEASVRHLSCNESYSFSSVHWQLDANFWTDYPGLSFGRWVDDCYNHGISSLVAEWVAAMRHEGEVRRWYPFLDTTEDLLAGRGSKLRCGSGYTNYTILTNGMITPCPCMVGVREWYLGSIYSSDPASLPAMHIGGECLECPILSFCGGRCLYSSITRPWPPEGRKAVCRTVWHLYTVLHEALPEIRSLIEHGVITIEQFAHEKFQGSEVIP